MSRTAVGMKLGKETGSVMNWLKSHNNTVPVVGTGATHLMWTDRHAYSVMWFSGDGGQVTLRRDRAERCDNLGMSDSQKYAYHDEKGSIVNLVRRTDGWRQVIEEIVLTKDFSKKLSEMDADTKATEIRTVFKDADLILVKGKTRIKNRFEKFNVIFGKRDEYYDYSF